MLADGMLWVEIGPKLTCIEAEALAALLVAINPTINPLPLLVAHAASDEDEEDRHHAWRSVEL